MKRTIFHIIFLLTIYQAAGQNLYSIKFDDEDGIAYNCLMVYYDPGDCYMRIRYKENGQDYLVHVEYDSKPVTGKNKQGNKYFYMKGAPDTEYLMGDTAGDYEYDPDCFIWYTLPDGERDGPYVTDDTLKFTNQRKVKAYTLLNPRTITENYLLQFYLPDEEELAEMKLMCGLDKSQKRFLPPLVLIPTMHFIMAANTADKKIGVSCAKDEEKLEAEFRAIARTLGINYKSYFLNANDLSREKLLAKLGEVNPTVNDIVVFSYSGHGSRWNDQKDIYPFMNLWTTPPYKTDPENNAELEIIKASINQNSMSLSEVYNMITKKSARLNIVLGDLCNAKIGVPRPLTEEIYLNDDRRGAFDFIIRDTLKLRKLFIQSKGNIISVAAKPDEYASGNASGGYFTTSFVEALREEASYRSKSSSWDKIMQQTIDKALIYRKKADPTEVQTGLRFMKVTE